MIFNNTHQFFSVSFTTQTKNKFIFLSQITIKANGLNGLRVKIVVTSEVHLIWFDKGIHIDAWMFFKIEKQYIYMHIKITYNLCEYSYLKWNVFNN